MSASKYTISALGILLVLSSGSSVAADEKAGPLDGEWEVTSRFVPKVTTPVPIPEKVRKGCLSGNDFLSGKLPIETMPACKLKGVRHKEGNAYELDMQCPTPPVERIVSSLTLVDPKNIRGGVTLTMIPAESGMQDVFEYAFEAKWTGTTCAASY